MVAHQIVNNYGDTQCTYITTQAWHEVCSLISASSFLPELVTTSPGLAKASDQGALRPHVPGSGPQITRIGDFAPFVYRFVSGIRVVGFPRCRGIPQPRRLTEAARWLARRTHARLPRIDPTLR
jgi:hypothetical protein